MNLSELVNQKGLTTEEKCVAYLEKMRWPGGVRCPNCGNDAISHFQAKGKSGKVRHLYQCLDKGCRYQFSATTGTIFHDSHLPLNKWFAAIALVSESEKPLSTNQLRQALDVQYKTAAHLALRIRQAVEKGTIELTEIADDRNLEPIGRRDTASPEKGISNLTIQAKVVEKSAPDRLNRAAALELETRRKETATVLSAIAPKPHGAAISGTAVDNMLSMFVLFAQISVRPPLFFVNYIKERVFT